MPLCFSVEISPIQPPPRSPLTALPIKWKPALGLFLIVTHSDLSCDVGLLKVAKIEKIDLRKHIRKLNYSGREILKAEKN